METYVVTHTSVFDLSSRELLKAVTLASIIASQSTLGAHGSDFIRHARGIYVRLKQVWARCEWRDELVSKMTIFV